MKIKQHTPNQWVKNIREMKKYLEMNEKENNILKLTRCSESAKKDNYSYKCLN